MKPSVVLRTLRDTALPDLSPPVSSYSGPDQRPTGGSGARGHLWEGSGQWGGMRAWEGRVGIAGTQRRKKDATLLPRRPGSVAEEHWISPTQDPRLCRVGPKLSVPLQQEGSVQGPGRQCLQTFLPPWSSEGRLTFRLSSKPAVYRSAASVGSKCPCCSSAPNPAAESGGAPEPCWPEPWLRRGRSASPASLTPSSPHTPSHLRAQGATCCIATGPFLGMHTAARGPKGAHSLRPFLRPRPRICSGR